jgi:hypothetical protein
MLCNGVYVYAEDLHPVLFGDPDSYGCAMNKEEEEDGKENEKVNRYE